MFQFRLSEHQSGDGAIAFEVVCEDVPPCLRERTELEFSGTNLTFEPAKVALKDIFGGAAEGAFKVSATPASPGPATAIMTVKIQGSEFASVKHELTIG